MKKITLKPNALWLLLPLVVTGCRFQTFNSFSGDKVTSQTDSQAQRSSSLTISFNAARKILVNRCITCHAEFAAYSENDFVIYGYVVPGSPQGSMLYQRLKGVGMGGQEDMPKDGTSLSATDLNTLRAWITNIGSTSTTSGTGGGGGGGGSGGGGPTGPTGPAALRFTDALGAIQRNCASCHNVTRTAVSTFYSGATVPAFANFVSEQDFVTRGMVDPGIPMNSWIFRALRTYGDIGTMPKSGGTLSTTDRDYIEQWITYIGAP